MDSQVTSSVYAFTSNASYIMSVESIYDSLGRQFLHTELLVLSRRPLRLSLIWTILRSTFLGHNCNISLFSDSLLHIRFLFQPTLPPPALLHSSFSLFCDYPWSPKAGFFMDFLMSGTEDQKPTLDVCKHGPKRVNYNVTVNCNLWEQQKYAITVHI